MKKNNILRVSILPLILLTVLALSDPQKDKGQGKSEGSEKNDSRQGGSNDKGNKNQGRNDNDNNHDKGHDNNSQANKNNHDKGRQDHSDQDNGKKSDEKDHSGKNKSHSDQNNVEIKRGNGNSKIMNGKRDGNIDWGFDNFAQRKHPKNQKKVSICHNPSGNDSNNSVSINISENAVQAHLNHGDQLGNCNVNYSDRWSSDYIRSREVVYNNYEQTYETMSYSEALLKYAMEKLLGVRTNLNTNRTNYSSQEVQRREGLILDLQNNVTDLENQLDLTRNRLDSDVNIIVQL